MRLPDEMSRAVASQDLQIKQAGRGVLVLSGKAIEHAVRPEHRREFIDRVFSIPGLSGLALDGGHARLRLEHGGGSTAELLRRLAKAMRSEKVEHFELADLDLVEVLAPGERPIDLWRAGNRLTFLRVEELRPERYRFFHPEFRDPSARSAILDELMGVAYLTERIGSGRNGGYIEVQFQFGRMTIESLLSVIESALLATLGSAARNHARAFHFRGHLVDTNLALAVLSDFLFPPARLLSVLTLWMLNARHVRPAARSLRNWKVNLDVLYSVIGLLTLLSLSFIASAIMYWMFEFWPRRVKRLREAEVSQFLARMQRSPRSVWVDREGTEMEVELSHLRLGDTVILREGDVAPGDGVSLSGEVHIAESWTAGTHLKKTGDVIHCSGRIAGGEARMRLDSLGRGAAASKLAQWHAEAMVAPVSHDRVKRLATSAVLPALALAAVAIVRGGVSMAKGVVRPDYVTGPMISRELGWVASAMEAAENGIFIGNESALEKLASCDCFIFGPGIAWRPGALGPEEIGKGLRELGVEEILTPRGGTDGGQSLALLRKGVADARPVDTEGLIKERQYLGRKVAFIGDCLAFKNAASQADMTVHVCHPPFQEGPPAEIALIEPELETVFKLRRIATAYNNRLRASFATALVPNVACVVGALYFGLPILGVVALTNAGTLASYLEAGRALRAASRPSSS
jgi:hypothetical protein